MRVDILGVGGGVGWGGVEQGGPVMFSWISTYRPCYAAVRSLGFPHAHHATLLDVLLDFRRHTPCYAAVRSL